MQEELIAEINIDQEGRLCVRPKSAEFPLIYREAMEVTWDAGTHSLCSPIPKEWSYARWFQQIVEAAERQGVRLFICHATRWENVDASRKAAIFESVPDSAGEALS